VTIRILMGALMAAFGLVLAGGALLQWEWFLAQRKYRRLSEAFGPLVPRLLYGVAGLVMIVFGVLNMLGKWQGGWDGRG
jgi:hypothetical protein